MKDNEIKILIGDISQQAFLANSNDKQCFVELLERALFSNGHNDFAKSRWCWHVNCFYCLRICVCRRKRLFNSSWHRSSNNAELYVEWHDGANQNKGEGTRKYKELVASTLGDIQKYLTFIHAFGGVIYWAYLGKENFQY